MKRKSSKTKGSSASSPLPRLRSTKGRDFEDNEAPNGRSRRGAPRIQEGRAYDDSHYEDAYSRGSRGGGRGDHDDHFYDDQA